MQLNSFFPSATWHIMILLSQLHASKSMTASMLECAEYSLAKESCNLLFLSFKLHSLFNVRIQPNRIIFIQLENFVRKYLIIAFIRPHKTGLISNLHIKFSVLGNYYHLFLLILPSKIMFFTMGNIICSYVARN